MPEKKNITLNEVGELVQHVVKHMATKEDLAREISAVRADMATKEDIGNVRKDIAELRVNIVEIRTELADIRQRLENLEEIVGEHSHYTKEIDHALSRIAVIEKHLGIEAD